MAKQNNPIRVNEKVEKYVKDKYPTYRSLGMPALPRGMKFPMRLSKGKIIGKEPMKFFIRLFPASYNDKPYLIYVKFKDCELIEE